MSFEFNPAGLRFQLALPLEIAGRGEKLHSQPDATVGLDALRTVPDGQARR